MVSDEKFNYYYEGICLYLCLPSVYIYHQKRWTDLDNDRDFGRGYGSGRDYGRRDYHGKFHFLSREYKIDK